MKLAQEQVDAKIARGEDILSGEIQNWIDSYAIPPGCPEYLHDSVRESLGQFLGYVDRETVKRSDFDWFNTTGGM